MINPVKHLRQQAGLSVRKFGERYGFSASTVQAIENGWYAELSTDMLSTAVSMCAEYGVDYAGELRELTRGRYGRLPDAYAYWIVRERAEAAGAIHGVEPRTHLHYSPFRYWRLRVAETPALKGFASMVKVQPVTIKRYEEGKTLNMPGALFEALTAMEYPYLSQLVEMQRAWAVKQ